MKLELLLSLRSLKRIRSIIVQTNRDCFNKKLGFIFKARKVSLEHPLPINYNVYATHIFDMHKKNIGVYKSKLVRCNELSVLNACYISTKPVEVKRITLTEMHDAVMVLSDRINQIEWDILNLNNLEVHSTNALTTPKIWTKPRKTITKVEPEEQDSLFG